MRQNCAGVAGAALGRPFQVAGLVVIVPRLVGNHEGFPFTLSTRNSRNNFVT